MELRKDEAKDLLNKWTGDNVKCFVFTKGTLFDIKGSPYMPIKLRFLITPRTYASLTTDNDALCRPHR